MQENPMAAQGALRDPFIAEAINKLIAAGVVKMAWLKLFINKLIRKFKYICSMRNVF